MSDSAQTASLPRFSTSGEDPFGVNDAEGLRARKKKLTRRGIHEAALNLVAERGLDHVTAEEIAAAAGVSARTFFNYFPTKDTAVLGLPPDLPDLLGEALLARPVKEDLFTALTTIVRGWFVKMEEDPLRDIRRAVVSRDHRLGAAMVGANRELESALVRAAVDREGRRADVSPHDAGCDGDAAPCGDLRIRTMVAAVIGAARAAYVHAQQNATQNSQRNATHSAAENDPTLQRRRFAASLTDSFDMLAQGFATPARSSASA